MDGADPEPPPPLCPCSPAAGLAAPGAPGAPYPGVGSPGSPPAGFHPRSTSLRDPRLSTYAGTTAQARVRCCYHYHSSEKEVKSVKITRNTIKYAFFIPCGALKKRPYLANSTATLTLSHAVFSRTLTLTDVWGRLLWYYCRTSKNGTRSKGSNPQTSKNTVPQSKFQQSISRSEMIRLLPNLDML